jgi:hypothetical protein
VDKQTNSYLTAVAALIELAPKTPLESMLSVQAVATHFASVNALLKASQPDADLEVIGFWLNMATRLMRVFIVQGEALARLSGTLPQQRILVEKLTVHEGGQAAIVGSINRGRGGDA